MQGDKVQAENEEQSEPYRDGTINESRSASPSAGKKSQQDEVLRGES
jgi:hypothetical protein